MTRPYTRACRQTNFSEGGFVNKVPFLFFSFLLLFIFLPSLFSFLTVFALLSFFQVGPWPLFFFFFFFWGGGGVYHSLYTGEMGSQC